mmetsp:Transcript_76198/g.217685  ORF Transcript_76198/g.217685 Transcript_76198/m.217685 type:complete len:101 (+) Transcript_76198:1055-1357(+)
MPPLLPLFPTSYLRGDLWFSVIGIPLDVPFALMGATVFLTFWRSGKLYDELKLARRRWCDDGGLYWYDDDHISRGSSGFVIMMGVCCCWICCWVEIFCCW